MRTLKARGYRAAASARIARKPHGRFKRSVDTFHRIFDNGAHGQARPGMDRRLRRGLHRQRDAVRRSPADRSGGQHHAWQAARALRRPAILLFEPPRHAAHAARTARVPLPARGARAARTGAGQPRRFRSRTGRAQFSHLHDRHQRGGAAARAAGPPAPSMRRRACRSRPDHLQRQPAAARGRRGGPGQGFMPQLDAGFYQQTLFMQKFVCLASAGPSSPTDTADTPALEAEAHAPWWPPPAPAMRSSRKTLARLGVQ